MDTNHVWKNDRLKFVIQPSTVDPSSSLYSEQPTFGFFVPASLAEPAEFLPKDLLVHLDKLFEAHYQRVKLLIEKSSMPINPHDNLPAGAANDPNAPWNQEEGLCQNCDRKLIEREYHRLYPFADQFDDEGECMDTTAPDLEDFVLTFKICRNCD